MFSNDTDLVNPVTSWVASFLIFCSVTKSCLEHPSHRPIELEHNKYLADG